MSAQQLSDDQLDALVRTTVKRVRELASRSGGGLTVRLYWDSETDTTHVAIDDEVEGRYIHFEVPPERATEAFHHPYAYAGTSTVHRTRGPR